MIFGITKRYNFNPYNVLLVIAKNIPVQLGETLHFLLEIGSKFYGTAAKLLYYNAVMSS